jgi:hypothetical protein
MAIMKRYKITWFHFDPDDDEKLSAPTEIRFKKCCGLFRTVRSAGNAIALHKASALLNVVILLDPRGVPAIERHG